MIQINLLRISPDSKYLEFSVECPANYRFNTLSIKKFDYLTTTGYPTNSGGFVEAGNLYKKTSTKEVMRIATSIFGGTGMFQVVFKVSWEGVGEEPLYADGTKLSDKETIGVCSDVNNIYEYLLQCLLNLDSKCSSLTNDTRRAFILLFAHQEAMRLERIDEAENFYEKAAEFYNILKNNFTNCTATNRLNTNNCGCK